MLELYSHGCPAVGRLKAKTDLGGHSFKPDSEIAFFASSEVVAGVTPNRMNLTLPKDLTISLSEDGYVNQPTTASGAFSVLGVTVLPSAELVFDKTADAYRLSTCTLGITKMIATVPTAIDSYGRPSVMEVVLAPPGSSFQLEFNNPVVAGGDNTSDVWRMRGNLVINNQDLGYNPRLLVREMAIAKLQHTTDININGVTIKAYTWLLLDSVGWIVVPKS